VPDANSLRGELEILHALEREIREHLYSVEAGGARARAIAALAAAAAERAYARSTGLAALANETSDLWRAHLADVWRYLEGDQQRFETLSRAIAGFLTSPLNHTDGQDGPDDFDRPQTIASYSAAASVVFWGVDFATTAVNQIFELIDMQYDWEFPPERAVEVEHERDWALDTCVKIVAAASSGSRGITPILLAQFHL
jgi:hypothetical protein